MAMTAVEMGRKGGRRRQAQMTKEERSEYARMIVNVRWNRVRAEKEEKAKSGKAA
jgi:hypothetical protein